MVSVTQRIKEINQPRGGYLPIKLFSAERFEDHRVLNPVESVSPSLVGICVDYLTRLMKGQKPVMLQNFSHGSSDCGHGRPSRSTSRFGDRIG